ncbi:hypothetical protein H206_06171 [Candidatus Electrothrix aarhusensis]|uniref:Uncharacterized protein n=1 Tax=Candidatus Electrothrix aarhusensis TaxID=1859131 RepID=A0A3S3UDG5_9BACT|nr:hypothetical protein H206_06171 [Candidatus Electrothrix aarhusensis]
MTTQFRKVINNGIRFFKFLQAIIFQSNSNI